MKNNLLNSQGNKIGIISIVLAILGRIFFLNLMPESLYYTIPGKSWFDVMFLYFLIVLVLGIIGLVIGIKQRKTVGRVSKTLGILLPIVAILLTLFFGFTVELSIILRTT